MKNKKLAIDIMLIFFVGSFLIFPKQSFQIIIQFLSFYDFGPLKLIAVSLFIVYRKKIREFYKKATRSKEVIEGIPIEELIDFLFMEKKFPAQLVQSQFGINAKKYSKISQALARAEIIEKRPPQNCYCLNEKFSRAEVFSSLLQKNSFSDIVKPMKIFRS